MRITFTSDDGLTSVLLVDTRIEGMSLSGTSAEHQRNHEIAQYFRAESVKGLQRGNAQNDITLPVSRRCDDDGIMFNGEASSLGWFAEHSSAIPAKGSVFFDIQDQTGTSASFWLPDAVFKGVSLGRMIGGLLFLTYTFSGGHYVFDDPNQS